VVDAAITPAVKAWVLGCEFNNPVRTDAWQICAACEDRLGLLSAPQCDVGLLELSGDHVATSFPLCFPPCLTIESCQCPTCSTRPICSPSSGRGGSKGIRTTVWHPLRSHLEARHQRHLTGKDRHSMKVRVSLFVRVPATADCLNLGLPSDAEIAPRCADNGEDVLKGDTAKSGASYYIIYLQPFTNRPRELRCCAFAWWVISRYLIHIFLLTQNDSLCQVDQWMALLE
jgi:hypothetical protein